MKSCPQCNRTFEDTFTFCLIDGSVLSAPFDPHATLASPEPVQTEPQLIETLRFDEDIQEIPTIIRSPQPEQKPEGINSTFAHIAPAFEPSRIKDSPPPARRFNRLPLMIGALATFIIIGVAVFILANRADSTRLETLNENAATVNTAVNYSTTHTSSNSANSRATANTETTSSSPSANTAVRGSGTPLPRPSPASTPKASAVPSRSVQPGGKDKTIAAKPAETDTTDSAAPCAGKAYQVCEPNETRRCNAATGKWECRRSR
jgi:hypothetical protein